MGGMDQEEGVKLVGGMDQEEGVKLVGGMDQGEVGGWNGPG